MLFTRSVKHSALLLCLIFATPILSQNLIKNPSFEAFENCPKYLGTFNKDVINWSIPTQGSTDYFNSCSIAMGTPENFKGKQPADFGVGYTGMYLYAPDDYREYLQAELSEPLVKGRKYKVSFHVSLAELSNVAVKEFGILFSKNRMKIATKKVLSKKLRYQLKENEYNYLEIAYANFYSDTKDWVLIEAVFEAKGTEQYMIIGNFKKNNRTRLFKTNKYKGKGAYYYIDMVLVKAVDASKTIAVEEPEVNFELDKAYLFKNVLFEFNKFQLSEPAKEEMQRMYSYLNSDRSLEITIIGHSDSIGNKNYNKQLSLKRAKVVASYLLTLGLHENRILYKGLGSETPLTSNATKEGRKENRRVEFVITKL